MSKRDEYLRRTYGLTETQVEQMMAAQGQACAACRRAFEGSGKGFRAPVVDHCHRSGQVRRVLCNGCNRALGFIDDDVELMRALADYVESHHA